MCVFALRGNVRVGVQTCFFYLYGMGWCGVVWYGMVRNARYLRVANARESKGGAIEWYCAVDQCCAGAVEVRRLDRRTPTDPCASVQDTLCRFDGAVYRLVAVSSS